MVTKDDCFKRGSYSANSYTEAAKKVSEDEGWDDTEKVEFKEGEELFITITEMFTKEFISEEEQRYKQWDSLAISGFAEDWENQKDAIL